MMLTRRNKNYGLNLFDDFFNDPVFNSSFIKQEASLMRTDIQDKGDAYLLDIELPGFAKENINAELKDGYLTISAEKAENHEQSTDENNYIRRERFNESCRRSFYVGEFVRQEDMKANFANGILTISVPKETPKAVEDAHHYIAIE